MGGHALKKLGREREKGVKLHCVVEFQNCFGDGIQYVTGATFGKNNLHLNDKGKFAASFYDLVSDRNFRLRMNDEVVKQVLVYGRAGKDVKKLPADRRAAEAERLMEKGRDMVAWLKGLKDEELFVESEAEMFVAAEGPLLEHAICKRCGELTLTEYTSEINGVRLCGRCG